jgi:hypothetical protein
MWPANSGYCWFRRDSGGQKQGPGDNVFASANAAVDAATGHLVVSIVRAPGGGGLTCGEVFLDRSLGFGDYVFVVQTDPSLVSGDDSAVLAAAASGTAAGSSCGVTCSLWSVKQWLPA